MTDLPECETLDLQRRGHALLITLNRPGQRNAMNLEMVSELASVFTSIAGYSSLRAVVLRGAGGHFCAGADVHDLAAARSQPLPDSGNIEDDPFYQLNRRFGRLMVQVDRAPQTTIAVLEGAVLGGGLGLACVSDFALCVPQASLGLPETGLGIPPAQIAPFVVKRIGITETRRLALLGMRFDGLEAVRLGIAHELAEPGQISDRLEALLEQVLRCAPNASRVTKDILHRVGHEPLEALLDHGAAEFARALRGNEGREGTLAFVQKRNPKWAGGQA